jgi:hypothetical protein
MDLQAPEAAVDGDGKSHPGQVLVDHKGVALNLVDIVELSRLIQSQLQARAPSGGAQGDAQGCFLAVLEIPGQGVFAGRGDRDHVRLLSDVCI